MELIELEKGMILNDCYVVLGVVQKNLNKAKKHIRTLLVYSNRKILKYEFYNKISSSLRICTLMNYTNEVFSSPCTNGIVHYLPFDTSRLTVTGYVDIQELNLWLMKSNVTGSLSFGTTYGINEALDILYSYYLELFLPYDDFKGYLRKAKKKGFESFPEASCFQDRHLYYGSYMQENNKVLFEVVGYNKYIITLDKHKDEVKFGRMQYSDKVLQAWDLGYDMSNLVFQKDL